MLINNHRVGFLHKHLHSNSCTNFRLNLIPAVKKTQMLFLTKLTEVDIVNYIGESIDKRNFQFRVMGAVTPPDRLSLSCPNCSNNRRYHKIFKIPILSLFLCIFVSSV